MKKFLKYLTIVLIFISCTASIEYYSTTWAGTSSNQGVTYYAAADAIANSVFTAGGTTITGSNRLLTKATAATYLNIDATASPYASKTSSQVVVKSDLVAAATGTPYWFAWEIYTGGVASGTNAIHLFYKINSGAWVEWCGSPVTKTSYAGYDAYSGCGSISVNVGDVIYLAAQDGTSNLSYTAVTGSYNGTNPHGNYTGTWTSYCGKTTPLSFTIPSGSEYQLKKRG